jgi:signal transduction histidine kinase
MNEQWGHFEESLLNLYGENAKKQLAIKVRSPHNEPIYVSPCWPTNLPDSKLPALALAIATEKTYEHPVLSRFPIPFNDLAMRELPPRMHIRGPVFSTASVDHKRWRIVGIGNEAINIFIVMNLAPFSSEFHRFINFFLIAMPVAILLLACGGWLIARRALRPVSIITDIADGITTRALDQRIPKTEADKEFARLVDVINGMLARLEKSFHQAVRFSGDAAHELKTPLTILQGELEQALQEEPVGSEAQQRYGVLLEEVQRLVTITRKLLLLSQADSGQMRLNLEPFCLSSAIETMCDDVAILAPDIVLDKAIQPNLHVMADSDLMNQAIYNLITNAVKYNRKDGWIKLVLQPERNMVKFTISNSGEDIPHSDQSRIFDRFFRVSKSRDRMVDGVGLGLSLAREIVLAHKGELFLESSLNGVTSFTMRLSMKSDRAC